MSFNIHAFQFIVPLLWWAFCNLFTCQHHHWLRICDFRSVSRIYLHLGNLITSAFYGALCRKRTKHIHEAFQKMAMYVMNKKKTPFPKLWTFSETLFAQIIYYLLCKYISFCKGKLDSKSPVSLKQKLECLLQKAKLKVLHSGTEVTI